MTVGYEKKDNLTNKTIKSGMWMFGLRLANKLFGVLRKVILARILAPNDFGIFGIALLMMSASEAFTKTGFDRALIQRQDGIENYLNTAWIVEVVRGVVLALLLFSIAPTAAIFFDEPLAVPILRVLALSEVFKGLKSIRIVYFERELKFRKKFVYMLSGTIGDFVISIIAALILQNAWALVFGILSGDLIRSVVSYKMVPFKPTLEFSKTKAKELFDFGKWKLLSGIIIFLSLYIDDLAVGRILGATSLALFQMAFQMSNITASEITHAVLRVAFPSYSKIQHDRERLRKAYKKTLELILTFSLPIAGGMIVLAPLGIEIVLGSEWLGMTGAFQILAVMGVLRTISESGTPVFYAVKSPKANFTLNKWRLLVLIIIIFPFTSIWGLEGAAIASTLALTVSIVPLLNLLTKFINGTFREYIRLIYSPLVSAIVMVLILISVDYLIEFESIGGLVFMILLGGVSYMSFLFLSFKYLSLGPWNNIKQISKQVIRSN
ncbi:lipopolysaccharide biosynthesis protein [Natranaerobius trueperi]|uniref:Uncharacterized protein n=1 Tax=Natranaerobius trueperi TaxID=759412 RepID=A0A226C106_9FIRM|nr:lipopolysaccharide biosynthesis protein [Natranaerobius trueperi]OWZ84978.1 hypothetical protein CDO51_00820 [Natranaerobius trueperi]